MSTLRKALNQALLIIGANWPLGTSNLARATWKVSIGAGAGTVGCRDVDDEAVMDDDGSDEGAMDGKKGDEDEVARDEV